MRQVVRRARLVRQGMHQPQTGAVKRHARQILTKSHLLARFQVVTVVDRFRQPEVDQANRLQRVGIGQRVRADGHVSFNGVSQGIHAGCGGHGGRNIKHHAGIVHGDIRDDVRVDNHLFHLSCGVNDHRVAGHLRCRACGGVDRHQRHARVFHLADARVIG